MPSPSERATRPNLSVRLEFGKLNAKEQTMKITVRSVFDCSPDFVWETVQTSELLLQVTRPLMRIEPAAGVSFPERWQEGKSVSCQLYLFGFLPLGGHTIRFERIDPQSRQIQSNESGQLVRSWLHRIEVAPAEGGRALYCDEVEIDAGLLTPLVAAFARVFYGHRQRRWKKLIGRRERTVVAGG
jgi:hypothetical protein